MLVSSSNTIRTPNSLTHFVLMKHNCDSNLESVRSSILVIQGVHVVFITQLVVNSHTFPVLVSSSSKFSTPNSLTHFVLIKHNWDSNLEFVRSRNSWGVHCSFPHYTVSREFTYIFDASFLIKYN